MRIADFIIALKEQQIELEVQEGNLKITVPKGSNVLTDELKQQIRERKAAIIDFFAKAGMPDLIPDIPLAPGQPHYAMSRSQKRFWVLHQLGESALVYNMCRSLMLEGPLDVPVLEKALQYVISRHESLRTYFRENEAGEVRQFILTADEMPSVLTHADISHAPDPYPLLQSLADQEQLTPFDLRKSPPLRVKLIKVREGLHAFFYTMYHIISDGWSMEVLGKELIIAYNSFRKNTQPLLEPLPFQYKDYSAWLDSPDYQQRLYTAEKYWLQQLAGELPVLDLPADKVRPPVKTHTGASFSRTLSAALLTGLRSICQQEGVTLFTGLLAGINTLFYRYTNQQDIVIGLPVAGREWSVLENQIGLYLNTVALRTRFNGTDTFPELLRKQKQVLTDAYEHQLYSLDMLLQSLQPERDMSRSPLFDVLVVYQINEPAAASDHAAFEGLQANTAAGTDSNISEYDLLFNFSAAGEEVHLSLTYNKDIFSQRNVTLLYQHLEQLLNAAVLHRDEQISSLDYLSAAEKEIVSRTLNKTDVSFPTNETIVSLFEKQVLQSPDNIAVDAEDALLTYRELNERANMLAHYLRDQHAVTADQPVGLIMDKTARTIIAILGILKAGAAYVPIDPAFPESRQHYIIQNAGITLVLTDGYLSNDLPGQVNFVNLRKLELSAYAKGDPDRIAAPSNLAYIIYTSGTTGNPKGAMISHRNVVRLLFNDANLFTFTRNDVWTMFHAYNFDFSVWEMYGALLYGGKLIVVPPAIAKDSYKYWRQIREKGVTVLNQTPSAFYNLMQVALEDEYEIASLRYVIFGGEALQPAELKDWKNTYPQVKLINMYGITETTVHTTYKEITVAEITAAASNIGRPIPTVGIYILDPQQQLLPIGVPGEICVCGEGLAKGYINNPALTAEKFVPDPLRPGKLMYRSGDIGRWLADGNIEYIGRKDHQVKIRGYRIETGEIEAALLSHDRIRTALVIARPEPAGHHHYLTAYIIAEEVLDSKLLRNYLSNILPAYMIPAWFVQLDNLPLTPNGKMDVKALPDPMNAGMPDGGAYTPLQTVLEKQLAEIWQEILSVQTIGRYDNFFELGGHSLAAMQVISRVHREMNVKIELQHFFEYPVLEALASTIAVSASSEQPAIVPVPEAAYYELSYVQRSLWMLAQFEEGKTAYNISSVLQFDGALDIAAFENCLYLLVQRHESLRTTFLEVAGEPKQKVHPPTPEWLGAVYTDLRSKPEQATWVEDIRRQEVGRSFDLIKGPLLSVRLLHLADSRFILLFTIHHLICDGWSLDLLVEEATVLYNSSRYNSPNPLPPLRIQYKDYTAWEKSLLAPAQLASAKAFWTRHFEGGIKPVSLLGGKSAAASRSFKGASHTFKLDNTLKQGLEQLERKYNVTLYALMLSIFNVFLSKISKEEDVAVLCASAGREHTDLEKTLGVFVRTFGIRNFPSRQQVFADFLSAVMKRYLEVVRYNYYPFEMLLDDLEQQGNRDRNAGNVYFQIDNFSSFETKKSRPGMQDVAVSPLFNGADTSKADLMLYITQNPDEWYVTFEFKTDLFSPRKIALWSAWFRNLVAQIVNDPLLPLEAYQLGNGEEPELYELLQQNREELVQLHPLSARQEDFYLSCKIQPRGTAHRVIFYTVEETLDRAQWLDAIGVINEIFPILKTKLIEADGEVYQGIRQQITLNTEEINLSDQGIELSQLEATLGKYVTIDHGLDKELVKYFLIRINDHCVVNLISIHHLISDVTSSVSFFKLFDKVYGKKRDEIPAALFDQYQYHEYVKHNQQQFDTAEITKYWKGKLEKVAPLSSNVYDLLPEESIEETLVLPPGHMAQISEYCRQHNISEALYFRGLYSLMVQLYAAPAGNFIINDITHGRDALTKDTFGCFTAILPLVYEAPAFSTSVEAYLLYLKKQKKEIAGRQFITVFLLNRLVSTAGLKFYYNYQTLYTLKEGSSQLVKVLAYFAKDEVQFSIRNTAAGQTLILNYNKAYFNATGFLERLYRVSDQFLSGLQELKDLNTMLPGEAALFSENRVMTPTDWQPVYHLFREHALRTPDLVAISGQHEWTYGALYEKAEALAGYLRTHYNTGRGDLVAIIAGRSPETVIALLAVLRSGAAYVPIDPEYPAERIAHICKDAGVKAVLTTSRLLSDIPEGYEGGLFALDIQLEGVQAEKGTFDEDIRPSDIAYVIYTSGSTGKPKGCMVTHQNLYNYLSWANGYYWDNDHPGNWALCTSIAFDLTITSIFTPLARGRRLYIREADDITVLLKEAFTTPGIDTLKLTPSHIALAGALNIPTTPISTVICGGEQLMPEHVEILLGMNPAMQVFNEYGPTETTVGCTVRKIVRGDEVITAGKAIAHTEILILNEQGRLLPAGIPGEICIAGASVAAGYLQEPQLTAEKFKSHPFRPGERMYLSGDIGRRTSNGDLVFMGRKDEQVKIRGHRVEPGEIEAVLLQHDEVTAAAVLAQKEAGNGSTYLAAFVVINNGKLDVAALRHYLSALLPEFMVPTVYVQLEQMPLNINGKVDRKALPAMMATHLAGAREYVAPANETEEKLAIIWEEVLARQQVSALDNFFDIGGHSLKAMQVISRIHKSFNIEIELGRLFEIPVLRDLAEHINNDIWFRSAPDENTAAFKEIKI